MPLLTLTRMSKLRPARFGRVSCMSNLSDIEVFLTSYPAEVRELASAARKYLSAVLPNVEETLDKTSKVIGYAYGPGYKGMVCTLILSKTGVKLGIVRGAELADPEHLMQGKGKVHLHVQLKTLMDLKQPALKSLIESALASWKERRSESQRPRPSTLPERGR